MIVGTYERAGEVSRRLLDALPALAVVRAGPATQPLVDLLAGEMVRDEPGQEAVLDRLLDLLLVTTVRTWFAGPEADTPAWYRANDDPVVGHALRLLHQEPAAPWTVATLAHEVGVSRATLARRFADEVGEIADGLPHRVATGAGRRPAPRARRHRRRRGPPGGLRHRLRAQRRLLAGAGHQPIGAPRPRPHRRAAGGRSVPGVTVDIEPAPDLSDLRAVFLNCTLKRSPERSHTEGLVARSMAIMRGHGVDVETDPRRRPRRSPPGV